MPTVYTSRIKDGQRFEAFVWRTDTPVNEWIWASFVMWAFEKDDVRKEFEEETGMRLPSSPATPLEGMIDQATGYAEHAEAVTDRFVLWVTERYWGIECAPRKVREAIEAQQGTHEGR